MICPLRFPVSASRRLSLIKPTYDLPPLKPRLAAPRQQVQWRLQTHFIADVETSGAGASGKQTSISLSNRIKGCFTLGAEVVVYFLCFYFHGKGIRYVGCYLVPFSCSSPSTD